MKTFQVTIRTDLAQFVYLFEASHSIDATVDAMERYGNARRISVRVLK